VDVEKEAQLSNQRWKEYGSWDGCEKTASWAKLAEEGVHCNPRQDDDK
jgi:hypothetical protein